MIENSAPNPGHRVICSLCHAETESVDVAIDAGWIASYYDHRGREQGPACPSCTDRLLAYESETDTYELRGNRN